MSSAAASETIQDGVHRGALLAHVAGHDIIACDACGFRHALPLPSPETLARAYREDYYTEEKPSFLAHAGEDQPWFALSQADRLELIEQHRPPGRLLDIGCGPGFFLQTAQARGWHVHGIEPSRQAAAHARDLGAAVTEGFFEAQSAAALGRFDAIALTNVLEHVPDPAAILALAIGLLDPGGVLLVCVPNDYSPMQLAGRASAGVKEWWLAPPHHLNYFDFDSLERLLVRLGLEPRARTTSFPMEAFLMMGENYVGDPAKGRACHARRKAFDFAFENAGLNEARRGFYRALAGTGIGREAVVVAVKP